MKPVNFSICSARPAPPWKAISKGFSLSNVCSGLDFPSPRQSKNNVRLLRDEHSNSILVKTISLADIKPSLQTLKPSLGRHQAFPWKKSSLHLENIKLSLAEQF
jgi:hypothetical protein